MPNKYSVDTLLAKIGEYASMKHVSRKHTSPLTAQEIRNELNLIIDQWLCDRLTIEANTTFIKAANELMMTKLQAPVDEGDH